MQISTCSVNICGLISKFKYKILQDYMQQFHAVCLTETKWDATEEKKIAGFEYFIMPKKLKIHKYGGIHSICVFIKECISHHCTIINNFVSESVVWIHFNKNTPTITLQ